MATLTCFHGRSSGVPFEVGGRGLYLLLDSLTEEGQRSVALTDILLNFIREMSLSHDLTPAFVTHDLSEKINVCCFKPLSLVVFCYTSDN